MKRVVAAMGAVGALLVSSVPVLAQAPPPKVTISGLVDQVTSWSRNMGHEDSNVSYDKDQEWYARTRVRPDLAAEVGAARLVLGLELDFAWGQTGSADTTANRYGTSGGWDLNTDTPGKVEVKWGYTEVPIPWLPWDTKVRLGAQPFRTTYKTGILASGDFAGVDVSMVASKEFKTHFTYAQVEEKGPGVKFGFQGEDLALVASMEITPIAGLDIRPLYAYLVTDGSTSTAARQGRGGLSPSAFVNGNHESRHTGGIDARWSWRSFYVDPTLLYQWGTRHFTDPAGQGGEFEQDRSAWFFDLRAGWQAGPLLVEGAFVYTTGNKAKEDVTKDHEDIDFYEPIDTDTSFHTGWANIMALGVDYFNILNARASGLNPGQAIGYDKYGLIRLGVRGSYALTPTFSPSAAVIGNWTAHKVDTDGAIVGCASGCADSGLSYGDGKGDSRYLGTEVNLGFTWRFAPSLSFDLVGAYLFAGKALESRTATGQDGVTRANDDREDVATVAARVRFLF